MKKITALVLASLLMVSMLSVAFADTYGLAAITTYGAVKNAEVKDNEKYEGAAPTDTVICSVVLDDEGKIKSVLFDTVQVRTKFTVEGKLVEGDYTAPVPSKIDKGEAYGMRKDSDIGKEWFEQADAFVAYALGKTAAQIDGIAVGEDGKPTGADLVASVTIPASSFKAIVLKGVSNAK